MKTILVQNHSALVILVFDAAKLRGLTPEDVTGFRTKVT